MAQFCCVSPFCSSSPSPPCLQFHRQHSPTAVSATDSNSTFTFASTSSNVTPKVVVTRERGKNSKLITALVLTHSLYRITLHFIALFSDIDKFQVVFKCRRNMKSIVWSFRSLSTYEDLISTGFLVY